MNILENVQQGSSAWLAIRAQHDTASEASAAMGLSKYQSRGDLLKQKFTGLAQDVGRAKQQLFDRGHAAEASARMLAETIAETDLYPVTASMSIDGLALLASYDGASMDETLIWEHKLFSEKLAADVRAGTLDPHYTIQMDQQLLISGARQCLFMTSDGTEDNMAWCWYESSAEKFAALVAGWKQFRADLAAYVPTEEAAPVAIGRAPETLPALRIEVTGMVTASNLADFKDHALTVFGGINRELSTDAQFADAEKTVKWCADVEERLAAAKQHALSQTESIDALFRTIDDISAEARKVRLELDKLVKARKEAIRGELVAGGIAAQREHIAALNTRLGKPYMPAVNADFAGAIKGKRTVDSLHDAVDTELARFKIEASAIADKIQINLGTLRELATAHAFLFADTSAIVLKAPDDLTMLVKSRIAEHLAAEAAKEEATRERIREEERIKAEAEIKAKADKEKADAAVATQSAMVDQIAKGTGVTKIVAVLDDADDAPVMIFERVPPANVVPLPTPQESAARILAARLPDVRKITPPSLKLGQIGERLGFNLTGEFLKNLGFEPAARDKSALLFHEADFALICMRLVSHIQHVQAQRAA